MKKTEPLAASWSSTPPGHGSDTVLMHNRLGVNVRGDGSQSFGKIPWRWLKKSACYRRRPPRCHRRKSRTVFNNLPGDGTVRPRHREISTFAGFIVHRLPPQPPPPPSGGPQPTWKPTQPTVLVEDVLRFLAQHLIQVIPQYAGSSHHSSSSSSSSSSSPLWDDRSQIQGASDWAVKSNQRQLGLLAPGDAPIASRLLAGAAEGLS